MTHPQYDWRRGRPCGARQQSPATMPTTHPDARSRHTTAPGQPRVLTLAPPSPAMRGKAIMPVSHRSATRLPEARPAYRVLETQRRGGAHRSSR